MDPVTRFVNMTGTDVDQAKFFLDGAGGNLEAALNLYYSGESVNKINSDLPSTQSTPSSFTPIQSAAPPKSIPKKTNPPKPKMFTLSDLNRSSTDDDDDDDKKGTETYAGGTSSGLAVQNPHTNPKKPATPHDMSKELFDKAKEQGAIDHETYKKQKESATSSFQGQGHRLGGLPGVPTAIVPAQKPNEIEISIYVWTDGFSVDEGPLRDFTSPENVLFLQQVQKGEIPMEIKLSIIKDREPGSPIPQVIVNLVKRDTPYTPPPKKFKAFSGEGRSLSSNTTSSTTTSTTTTSTFDPYSQSSPIPSDTYVFRLDENSPVTSLRITLIDGTRLQAKFNLTHTIADVRRFIARSKPNQPDFDIAISPPLHIFKDDSLTLEQAGLKNASVIQRAK